MKFLRLIIILGLLPLRAFAAGQVTYLAVEEGRILFRLSELKTHSIPTCVDDVYAQHWAMELNSNNGKANHLLLVAAISSGIAVQVESAATCVEGKAIEAALAVSLIPTTS